MDNPFNAKTFDMTLKQILQVNKKDITDLAKFIMKYGNYNTTKEIADEDEKAIKCDYLYRNGLISDEISTAIQENVYNSDNFDKAIFQALQVYNKNKRALARYIMEHGHYKEVLNIADEEENMHFMEAVQYLYNNKVIPDAIATSLMEKIMSRFSNTQEKNGKECNDD